MMQRRNRRSSVEDRWTKNVRDDDGTTLSVPSANHGKGKRWRARYVDDVGRECAKGSHERRTPRSGFDSEVTAKFATGTYVAPSAGRVTVNDVFQSWFPAQSHISAKTGVTS